MKLLYCHVRWSIEGIGVVGHGHWSQAVGVGTLDSGLEFGGANSIVNGELT